MPLKTLRRWRPNRRCPGRFPLPLPLRLLALCVVAAGFEATAFGQFYTAADLGYPYDSYSESHGLNDAGNVVGEYEIINFPTVNGFIYTNGVRTDLGFLYGSPYAVASGINATNEVVGESNAGGNTHAFKWVNGTMSDLGTLWGTNQFGTYSSAHAVNRSGQVVGESNVSLTQQNTIYAVLWDGGTIKSLGALAGGYSSAFGINSAGVVVGNTDVRQTGVTNLHAFVYTNSTSGMKDLGTLPGGDDYSAAFGINDSSVIVGESNTSVSGSGVTNTHAFVYTNAASGMVDLGTLPGGTISSASAINSLGQIVGYSTDANGNTCAVIFTGSGVINLNNYIPPDSAFTNLSSADAINDAGQIAGSGFLADGSYHAYLLTPAGPLIVAITNPAAHEIFAAPATFPISAFVSDSAGTVTNVQFLVDTRVFGNATAAPYSATATGLGIGTYSLTAIAADDGGLHATNTITITVVDAPPQVAITNPVANAVFTEPATFPIAAFASDSDGTVTNVQFQINGAIVSNVTAAPYAVTASGLLVGTYTLTAIASDNAGLLATNSIDISVIADAPPTVTITNPVDGASFAAPATFLVSASASDSDGSVTNVEFLVGNTAISNVTVAPYSATVANLAAGNYTLSAIAMDNAGLTQTNSISISVTGGSLGSIQLLNPVFTSAGFAFSFNTQSGATYDGQYTTQFTNTIAASNTWLTFTSLVGNGSTVWVTNGPATNAQRFYRVMAH